MTTYYPHKSWHIQPFTLLGDGDCATLLQFARQAVPLIVPDFLAAADGRQIQDDHIDWEYNDWITRYGDDVRGFDCQHREEFEPRAGGHAVDIVIVSAYGLPEGMKFEIECSRRWYDPRKMEMRVQVPDEIAEKLRLLFEETFGHQPPLASTGVSIAATSAYVALKVGAYPAAEMYANQILQVAPDHVEALMIIGAARSAQGDLVRAGQYLTRALEVDPKHVDALYNLGLVRMQSEQPQAAIDLYRRALDVEPDNHAVWYQLARAYEEADQPADALAAYREALRTSPNPDGAWHYTGLDFTKQAREAIARLEK